MKRGVMLNVASVTIMSVTPLVNKFSVLHMSPVKGALFNTLFAIVFCWLYAILSKKKLTFTRNKALFWIGFLNAAGIICLYASLNLLSPVMVGFLGRFYIIFTTILSVLFLKEKINSTERIMVVVAILGTFMFVSKGYDYSSFGGTCLALVYTFLFALTNMLIKVQIKDTDSNSILLYNNLISVFFILIYSILTGDLTSSDYDMTGISLALLAAFLSGFLGLLLFYEGMKYLEFSKANLIRSVGPIITAIYSWWFFPIDLTFWNILGAILLIGSIVWISLKGGKKETIAPSHQTKGV